MKSIKDWGKRISVALGIGTRDSGSVTDVPIQSAMSIQDIAGAYLPETWAAVALDDGTRFWVDLGDLVVSRNCINGKYEPCETAFVRNFLRAGQTFLDIGANIGWFSMLAARIVGKSGSVFAFEPRNTTFHYLNKTIQDNGISDRMHAYNCALGAENAQLQIGWETGTINPGGTWLLTNEAVRGMLLPETHTRQNVLVRRLDDFKEIPHADLIKIDVEGAEPLVLRGAEQLLRKSHPVVLAEINAELLRIVGETSSGAFIRWMNGLEYQCHQLNELGLGPPLDPGMTTDIPATINVVFVPA